MDAPAEPVVITVRGSAASTHAPELATVALAVTADGPDQAEVYRRAVDAANGVVDAVRALADGGPVTRWSSDRLTTWFERPWGPDGRQQGVVHQARAVVRATFHDLDAFGRFLDGVAVRPGVAVEDVTWSLTEEHRREHERSARTRAVLDTRERAGDYAAAAGLTTVAVVAVADVGLIDDAPAGARRLSGHVELAMASSGPMGFSPGEIRVEATVEARYLATSPIPGVAVTA